MVSIAIYLIPLRLPGIQYDQDLLGSRPQARDTARMVDWRPGSCPGLFDPDHECPFSHYDDDQDSQETSCSVEASSGSSSHAPAPFNISLPQEPPQGDTGQTNRWRLSCRKSSCPGSPAQSSGQDTRDSTGRIAAMLQRLKLKSRKRQCLHDWPCYHWEAPVESLEAEDGWMEVVDKRELRDGQQPEFGDPDFFSFSMCYSDIELKKEIGRGSFGVVYSALYKGHLVAVKESPAMFSGGDGGNDFVETLQKELTVLEKVGGHPNVVRCYGGSFQPPKVFLVSELMHCSLAERIHHSNPAGSMALPLPLALSIVKDVAKGLHHLHHLTPKVVHRDLKPGNILLDVHDQAKVADFGISRSKHRTYLSTRNACAGTPAYLGPEAIGGKVDEKMDIYAVGVILWECLTGDYPWGGIHSYFILYGAANGLRPPFPESIFNGSTCMRKVKKLIQSCWAGTPSKRPSAGDLIKKIVCIEELLAHGR
ncbi:unnamed protein product [Ostreobium quekettii]|uniref:Protein kinase domain-containing protein n=1 Tax=Ostreobium quekettii TaxID=121088 RepID=A0A8S1ILL6_9CHLO|nr:unnamed protein product [Ostreobium quekettii]